MGALKHMPDGGFARRQDDLGDVINGVDRALIGDGRKVITTALKPPRAESVFVQPQANATG